MKFKPGKSGNPNGRPRGAKNKITIEAKTILEGNTEAITRKAVEMALDGDPAAMRLCMERIYPRPKELSIKTRLPDIKQTSDIPLAISKIFQMIGNGKLTIDQGKTLASIVTAQANVLELAELEKRITDLERKNDLKAG
jgi:hypothetical protein